MEGNQLCTMSPMGIDKQEIGLNSATRWHPQDLAFPEGGRGDALRLPHSKGTWAGRR